MAVSSPGLSPTCHLRPSVSDVVLFSSSYTSSSGVPQDSVLGHLLFIMYTTPLSTLISSPSLNHHLYADDTQLFFPFYPPNFDSSITHLQNALQQISSWMTANLLTPNSSKTEFLLIELKKHVDNIHNSSLNITHSTRNLRFIFDEHLTFPTKFQPSRKLAITILDSFVVSVLTLIPPQHAPPPPPSFILNSITVTLYTTTYLSLRLPASN